MGEVVDWKLAATIAKRVGGTDPYSASYHARSLVTDFDEFTAQAEELVASATGLRSLTGPARPRVVSRQEWIDANIRSFQRLFAPVTERLGSQISGVFAPAARGFAGAEVGTLLGWMSKRVLGQYDLMVAPDDRPDTQDLVYYVGPNVLALEKRFAFPPREFRLWLALHEVTHRAQFTGVPWMRQHYLDLVNTTMSAVDTDPKRFLEGLKRATDDVLHRRNPFDDGGIIAMIAGDEQRRALDAVGGLMSLLEGHGDITMDRAGGDLVPSAARFSRILSQRRAEVRGVAKLLRQLLGIEAKMRQYEQGEAFIRHIESARGTAFFDRVWDQSANLPSLEEIRHPDRWIKRLGVGTPGLAASPG